MAEKVYLKVDVDTKEAEKNVDDLNEGLEDTKTNMEDVQGAADDLSGGLITRFKGIVGAVKKGIGAFKSLRVAIAATGLGALVLVVGSLIASFKRSEEGQDRFAKLMGTISAVTAVFADRLANLGTLIIDVFTKPAEVFKNFKENFNNYISNQIDKALETLGLLGSAIKKVFSGDFKGAAKDAATGLIRLNEQFNPAIVLTKNLAKATSELVKEINNEAKAAGKIADMRAKAEKLQRELLVERAEAERKRAELMEKAIDKENFSLEERIKFTQEAAAVEDEITKKEIEASRIRLEAKQAENALGLSTKEDLEEEAQLKAELIMLETARLNRQKETTAQIVGFQAEAKAARDAEIAEEETKRKEREAQELKDKQELEKAKLEAEKKANDQRIAMEEAVQAARKNLVQQGFQAILGLTEAFAGSSEKSQRRAFQIQKKVQIAQTLMSTYQAITDAMAAKGGDALLPFPLRLANAVTAGVLGLANVKKIADTEFQAASASAGGAPVQQVAQASTGGGPSISTIGGTEQTQISSLLRRQEPTRAYVTQDDINSGAALDRHVVQNATLAG